MDPQAETPTPGNDTPPRKRLSRRASIIGSVIAVLVLAGTGWLAWHLTHPSTDAAAAGPGGARGAGGGRPGGGLPATTVGVATAERSSIPIVIEALGTVTPQATVRVRPQVSGVLEKVLFKEGQMVKAGDLLATIDPRQFEMALMQASGQRQRDEAQLDSARVTLQRFKTLLDQDSIARQEVDTQAALVKQLEGTVVIDKASEGTARLNLSYTRVVAPVSGRVGLRTVDVGNVVSSGDANGIALITQITPIDVVFSIPQDQVGTLQQNIAKNVAMQVAALDRTRAAVLDTGSFASLDNQVDTTTGTVKAKARFANSQLNLYPSQFVNVRLQVRTLENAVVVPVTALRLGGSGDYVYVVNTDRTVSLRSVTRGQATVEKIVITTGLQAGERVITEGADRLKDGSSVVLPGDPPGGQRGPGGRRQGQRPGGAASAPAGSASSPQPPAASASAATPAPMPAAPAAAAPPARLSNNAASPVTTAPAATTAAAPVPLAVGDGPTPEQRKRMLDQVKDDPTALERRQRFLAAIDSGEPAAVARWQSMRNNREGGRQGERPAQ